MNKNKKAFTLIELLVVVLIIGILAAIVVPQYQLAVAKSRYSTLKAKTRSLAEAINRYQLATGTIPESLDDLDISVDGDCSFLKPQNGGTARCFLEGYKMGFYFSYVNLAPYLCYTRYNNQTGNKVCQQETGKTTGNCVEAHHCTYYY